MYKPVATLGLWGLCLFVSLSHAVEEARAEEIPLYEQDQVGPDYDREVHESIAGGGFNVLTLSPTVIRSPATAMSVGGYDSARGRAVARWSTRPWRCVSRRVSRCGSAALMAC